MSAAGRVRVGTCGWSFPDWRGTFYPADLPAKRWFAYYAGHFDTVEINYTFYRLPPAETFASWRRQAPPGFLYAVKASRFLTHRKKLKDPAQPLDTLLERARQLGPHLGPLLYQLPPRWRCDLDRLAAFLRLLPPDLTHVFEFRDPSWYNPAVRDLLAGHGAGFCIHDLRGSASPDWVTARAVYLRFHGPTETPYAGRYPGHHLRAWAERIRRLVSEGHDVYAYFNNDDRAFAAFIAQELRDLVGLTALARA
jgi:uncharacterized protein YecE (DUF72 family)